MVWVKYLLLWASVIPPAESSRDHTHRSQFVNTGETAQIPCGATERSRHEKRFIQWYKRRENESPVLIKNCSNGTSVGRFACKSKGEQFVLEIPEAQLHDSGLYWCAKELFHTLHFFNGSSSLIVGDSYTPSSRVMLLLSAASRTTPGLQSIRLACVVLQAANFIQVTWHIPGGLQQEGQTFLVQNSSGSLTFFSLLRISVDSQVPRDSFACEVRFNASGTSVKKTATFPTATASCRNYTVLVTVLGLTALLILFLSFLWRRLSLSNPDSPANVSEPPPSAVMQESLCYAQLNFPSRTQDGNRRGREQQKMNI